MADGNVLSSLGINSISLVSQIINFIVLFWVLKKFLYQPILKKLDERSKLIAKGIKAAQDSIRQQEEMEIKKKKDWQKAQKEIEEMISKAKQEGTSVKAEIISQAKQEAEKLMDRKKIEINEILANQEKELQIKTVDIAAQVAKKVLEEYLDKEKQRDLLSAQMKKIAQSKNANN